MSKLAAKLPTIAPQVAPRKGPRASCDIYGAGTLEDYLAVQARHEAEVWKAVQVAVDTALGIDKPIKNDHFRYHWSGKCAHWDGVDGVPA